MFLWSRFPQVLTSVRKRNIPTPFIEDMPTQVSRGVEIQAWKKR